MCQATGWEPQESPASSKGTGRATWEPAPGHCSGCPVPRGDAVAQAPAKPRTTIVESLREAVGVVGREFREELALNSSELRLSEASLSPLLMELLSSQLQDGTQKGQPAPGAQAGAGTLTGQWPLQHTLARRTRLGG